MKIITVKDYKQMSKIAAEIVIQDILKKPCSILGLATGSTPLGLYKELIREYKKGKVDFSKIKCFNLDEYYPIKKNDKKSFYYYLFKNFFNQVNIKNSNINLLNGEAKNTKRECGNYENKIRKNPIDIQILGVGIDGHIAFNFPGSSFNSRTRLVDLTKKIKHPAKKALTMGIKPILSAKKIILLASGKTKAEPIRWLIKGKVSSKCPVSFLKKHKKLEVIIDKKSASLL